MTRYERYEKATRKVLGRSSGVFTYPEVLKVAEEVSYQAGKTNFLWGFAVGLALMGLAEIISHAI